jgi:hypothetical protein
MALTLDYETPQGDTITRAYAKLVALTYYPSPVDSVALTVDYPTPQGPTALGAYAKIVSATYANRGSGAPTLRVEIDVFKDKVSAELGSRKKPYNERPLTFHIGAFDPTAGSMADLVLDWLIANVAIFATATKAVDAAPPDGSPSAAADLVVEFFEDEAAANASHAKFGSFEKLMPSFNPRAASMGIEVYGFLKTLPEFADAVDA